MQCGEFEQELCILGQSGTWAEQITRCPILRLCNGSCSSRYSTRQQGTGKIVRRFCSCALATKPGRDRGEHSLAQLEAATDARQGVFTETPGEIHGKEDETTS